MIYCYARVLTDGQTVAAQVAAIKKAGAEKVFRETARGAKTDRQKRATIRRRERGNETLREIAASYDVSYSTILRLRS